MNRKRFVFWRLRRVFTFTFSQLIRSTHSIGTRPWQYFKLYFSFPCNCMLCFILDQLSEFILEILYLIILFYGISFLMKLFNVWIWSISKLHWKHSLILLCVQTFLYSISWFFLGSCEFMVCDPTSWIFCLLALEWVVVLVNWHTDQLI